MSQLAAQVLVQLCQLPCAEEQNWDTDAVLDSAGGGAQEEISEEAVAVSAHGHKVAAFVLDPFYDLIGGFAIGEFGVGGDVRGLHLCLNLVEIGGVFNDFAAYSVRAIGSRGPSVGDVEQDEAAMRQFGKVLDMFDDGAIA